MRDFLEERQEQLIQDEMDKLRKRYPFEFAIYAQNPLLNLLLRTAGRGLRGSPFTVPVESSDDKPAA